MHAAALANRALAREDWARERLATHAGRKLRIVAGPAALTLAINADGSFADSEEAPDLTLTIPPLALAGACRATRAMERAGRRDGRCGPRIDDRRAGANAAVVHRALVCSRIRADPRRTARRSRPPIARLARLCGGTGRLEFASYAGDESGLVTGARAGSEFAAEVAALAARVDALGERIDRLANPAPAKRR